MRPLPIPLVVFLLLIFIPLDYAQQKHIYMPASMIHAYKTGTRSTDGKPGPAYWQNTVDYDIDVNIIPAERKIEGTEKVIYYNNSPDELNTLVVRLCPNMNSRDDIFLSKKDTDYYNEGMILNSVIIDDMKYQLLDLNEISLSGAIMKVRLKKPLKSGKNLNITIKWEESITANNFKRGIYDSTTFFIANWYPQVAVYDDIVGWDLLNADNFNERYNNLGNYNVRITAPSNYNIWATGKLQNPEEVLAGKIFERYSLANSCDDVVQIIGEEDLIYDNQNHLSQKTWHYRADEVSDFAFCLSDQLLWNAASQSVGDRKVLISTVYPKSHSGAFIRHVHLQQQVMDYLSNYFPGVTYPYPTFTTIINRGACAKDYPMIGNCGMLPEKKNIVHSMFNNYFPFQVRINEKRYNFIDNGFADYIEVMACKRICKRNYTPPFDNYKFRLRNYLTPYFEMPLVLSSQFLGDCHKDHTPCWLPGFVFEMLHQHLGEELFQRCIQEYMTAWANKAPLPYDLLYTFEQVADQDLSWLWEPWFFQFGKMDLAIHSYENGHLEIANNGNRPVPIKLVVNYLDGSRNDFSYGPSVWLESNTFTTRIPLPEYISNLSVNAEIADFSFNDNFYTLINTAIYPPTSQLHDHFNGKYLLGDDNCLITITMVNEGLLFTYPTYNQKTHLHALNETEFESHGGSINVQFMMENEECTGLVLEDYWGIRTAQKQ